MADAPESLDHTRMSLGEHLEDLRKRLFRGAIALFITFSVGWAYYEPISDLVLRPYYDGLTAVNDEIRIKLEARIAEAPEGERELLRARYFAAEGEVRQEFLVETVPVGTSPLEGFNYGMTIAGYFAAATGAPYLLWQLWGFIGAGLYRHEKRAIFRYFPYSIALFLAGVSFAFYLVCPVVFHLLAQAFPVEKLRAYWQIREIFKLISTLCLGSGLIFQLPILQIFAMRLGLLTPEDFGKYRRHFILAAVVICAIISPPDIYSTTLMCGPMILLYEVGIVIGRLVAKPRQHPS